MLGDLKVIAKNQSAIALRRETSRAREACHYQWRAS
jgi:hypothetical protein